MKEQQTQSPGVTARRTEMLRVLLVAVPAVVSALAIPLLATAQGLPGYPELQAACAKNDVAMEPETSSPIRSRDRVISTAGSGL